MASSWLQIHHRTELLLHQKFLEIAFGANLDLFANVSLDGIILPEEAADASRINALYQAFFLRDLRENHGRADRVWRLMMNEAFPELIGMDLVRSLTYLTLVTWRWRRSSRRCFQFIEYFCGEGNLSKALLRINRRGIPFDIRLNPDHNFLTPSGIRLAILSLMMTAENALIWFGTPCSSWSIICLVWSRRYEENFSLEMKAMSLLELEIDWWILQHCCISSVFAFQTLLFWNSLVTQSCQNVHQWSLCWTFLALGEFRHMELRLVLDRWNHGNSGALTLEFWHWNEDGQIFPRQAWWFILNLVDFLEIEMLFGLLRFIHQGLDWQWLRWSKAVLHIIFDLFIVLQSFSGKACCLSSTWKGRTSTKLDEKT